MTVSLLSLLAIADGVVSVRELVGFAAFFAAYAIAPLALVTLVLAAVTRRPRLAKIAVAANALSFCDALLILGADRDAVFIAYGVGSCCAFAAAMVLTFRLLRSDR